MFTGIWPRLLKPGGTIGICSPAGPTRDLALLDRAKAVLESRGYRVIITLRAAAQHPERDYLAGTEDARLSDLNALLNNPAIDLILSARGGYGSAKLLDRLDWGALRRDPKPIVGYSDITALSLGIAAQTGVVSYSGIMATAGHAFGEDSLDPFSEASFWQAVTDPFSRFFLPPPDAEPWTIHRGPKEVSGPVFPVCLTLLTSLLGTPFVPDLTGAILVIEDIHEEPYAIDRALTQLRLAGMLDRLAALLVGSFNGVEGQDALLKTIVPELALEMAPPGVAVASGVAYGHIPCRLTLPVGGWATVDLEAGRFTFAPTPNRA